MKNLNQTAWITSCKTQEHGYLVNGTMGVPNDPANRHYVMVQEWIAEGNTPAPELTEAEIAANVQQVINSEAKVYLEVTGWYVERLNDPSSGKAIPQDISDARAAARLAVYNPEKT